jgi:hypothetical protein
VEADGEVDAGGDGIPEAGADGFDVTVGVGALEVAGADEVGAGETGTPMLAAGGKFATFVLASAAFMNAAQI